MFKLMGEVFSGPSRALSYLVCLWGLAFLVVAIVAATNMCEADELKGVILWATTFLFSVMAILAGKIWLWLEIHRAALRHYLESSR